MNADAPDSESDHTSRSSSPPASPRELSPAAPPTLARLINHFLLAKRSLSSTSFVYRANELVTTSRTLIEEIAILNARNAYSSRDAEESVGILAKVKGGITKEGNSVGGEFEKVIERLDVANTRLERTLADLKNTVLDNTLQQNSNENQLEDGDLASTDPSTQDGPHDNEGQRTLYTFIDPSKHERLQLSLRKDIDDYHSSSSDLNHTLTNFDESLHTISSLLEHDSGHSRINQSPLYNNPPRSVSDLFTGMEDHSSIMADLLEGLVRHYDLSVTALKHTEGGGEAAKRAVQAANGASDATMEESLYLKSMPEPISEEERNEMLAVLENDAEEVEDVVSELRDRNREQEDLFAQLTEHVRSAKQQDSSFREVLVMLHEMQDLHLPSHLHALQTFRQSWQRIRESILDKTKALLGLAASNESFLAAYAQLLKEIGRRRGAQVQMQKVAEKANREVKKLWEQDREERREFLDEFGAFLPQGIWDGADDGGKPWVLAEAKS